MIVVAYLELNKNFNYFQIAKFQLKARQITI